MAAVTDYTALLNEYGLRWNALTAIGTAAVVSYSFTQTVPSYGNAGDYPGFQPMNELQKSYVRQAIKAVDAISGIDFVEVPDSDQSQIRFGLHKFSGTSFDNSAGYAKYPNLYWRDGGDIYMASDKGLDFSPGHFGFEALLHEIGHAIGLKHSFEGTTTLTTALDNTNNTLMSYTHAGQYKVAMQSLDVSALGYYYGGVDTDTAIRASYITSSDRVKIEIVGSAGQVVTGTNSSDLIIGGVGNDTLVGGVGNDVLNGGVGIDSAIYYRARQNYSVAYDKGLYTVTSLSNGPEGYPEGKDFLVNVEKIQFKNSVDTALDGSGGAVFNLADVAVDQSKDNLVYRFYNTASGSHFFTASAEERNSIIGSNADLKYEGAAFTAKTAASNAAGEIQVYRFYNKVNGSHFYTASESEKNSIISSLPAFAYEGAAYYAYDSSAASGHTALYRFLNESNGTHFYTASVAEKDSIISTLGNYHYEGIAYYVDVA